MCGRFVAASPMSLLVEHFEVAQISVDVPAASYNVAPTEPVPAVAEHAGIRRLGTFRWGLVPSWARDPSGAARLINARAETLESKPAFREAFARRRCLIAAEGFYEWRLTTGGLKQPVYIHPAGGGPIAFAGLWEHWRDPSDPEGDVLRTCTIVTTSANGRLSRLHDRMPVVLAREDWEEWLDRSNRDTAALSHLLRPAPDNLLEVRDASRAVNDVRNKSAAVLESAAG